MKITIYIFIVTAAVMIVINATKLDFENLFVGESKVAVITILAAACVILLMLILRTSLIISKKKKK